MACFIRYKNIDHQEKTIKLHKSTLERPQDNKKNGEQF